MSRNVLILGAKGMLGDAVHQYLSRSESYSITTVSERWPSEAFKSALSTGSIDFIINCIGKIPQRNPTDAEYAETNTELPVFLDTLGVPVIHPSTDCEFSGRLPVGSFYTKSSVRDAEDIYGKSKALISERIESSFENTKIIRTSIIGHEREMHLSLLDWFLHSEGSVRGYTNHFWNGITTLMWAQIAENIMRDWDSYPVLNQYSTKDTASKCGVLETIKGVYGTDTSIEPFETPTTVNKSLLSDIELPDLAEQLSELKAFYQK